MNRTLLCALLCSVSTLAFAGPDGTIKSGHVLGNGTGSERTATDTPALTVLQQPGSGLGSGVAAALAQALSGSGSLVGAVSPVVTGGDLLLGRTDQAAAYITRPNTTGYKTLALAVTGGNYLDLVEQFTNQAAIYSTLSFPNSTYTQIELSQVLLNSFNIPSFVGGEWGSLRFYDGFSVGMNVPSTSYEQVNGVGVYMTSSRVPNGDGSGDVGGLFAIKAGAKGTNLFGVNPLVDDGGFGTATTSGNYVKLQNEFDFNVSSPYTVVTGIGQVLNASSAPYLAVAFAVETSNTHPWNFGFVTNDASATVAVQIGSLGAGASQSSQPIQFHAYSSGSATLTAKISEDYLGNLALTNGLTGSVVGFQDVSSGNMATFSKYSATFTVGASSNFVIQAASSFNDLDFSGGAGTEYIQAGYASDTHMYINSGGYVFRIGGTAFMSMNTSHGAATGYWCGDASGNIFFQAGAC